MALFGEIVFGETQFMGDTDGPVVIDVPVGSLTLTGFPPELEYRPPAGTLTLTGLVPSVAVGYPAIEPPTATLTLTGQQPFPGIGYTVPTAALVLTGFAPAYAEQPDIIVPTGALTLTGQPGPTLKYHIRLRQIYSLRSRFTHTMAYSLMAPLQATHEINYDLSAFNPLTKFHQMLYGLPFKVGHTIAYALNTSVKATHEINYSLTNEVRPTHQMLYDINNTNPVRTLHRIRYSILETTIVDVNGAIEILFDVTGTGVIRSVEVEDVTISKDENDLHWTCDLTLSAINDYSLFDQDDPFTLSIFGEEWEFLVDAKELSRDDPAGMRATLQGVSPTAAEDFPRVDALTQDFPDDITAQAAVTQVLNIAVDWQLVDWVIPGGRLAADRASPLDFAARIVEAAGGVLEAKKDGTWLARHLYPVSTRNYNTTTPDHVFNESNKIFAATEQFVPGRVVNRIRITDGDANFQDIIEFLEDENNPLAGELFVYPSPFRTTVQLLSTSLPADITLTPTTPTVQTREVLDTDVDASDLGELVEFNNCEANLSYPVEAINEVVWVGIDLGAVTFEQGSTTVSVAGPTGYSMARIKYDTKFIRYTVTAAQPIDAQFILEDVG